jgi:hypothetical protein
MDREEFQNAAVVRLNEWFGECKHDIIHTWFDDGIMYAVVKAKEHTKLHLYFFRVFTIGDVLSISQDKKMEFA